MEVVLSNHCKGERSLVFLMDHDSGYMDGMESCSTSSSNDSQPNETNVPVPSVQNFLLSEDALLEKPEFCNSLARNLPCAVNMACLEDATNMFSSPEVINCSVQSQSNSTEYDELGSQSSSSNSVEIPVEPAIVVSRETLVRDSAGESDMSFEQSFESKLPSVSSQSAMENGENFPLTGLGTETSESTLTATSLPNTTPEKCGTSCTMTNSCESSKAKKRLTLVFSKAGKENSYSVKRKYPSMTPDKKIPPAANPCISPDLFEDEGPTYFEPQAQDRLSAETAPPPTETYASKLDQKLLKRTMKGMSGVLPPPSVTVMHLSVNDILSKLKQNQSCHFWNAEPKEETPSTSLNSSTESCKSLLLSTDLEAARSTEWPHILHVRCHGLHYNCGKTSEEIVDLCDKYQKRHVSAETQSTCTVFETQTMSSPSKRRLTRSKWGAKSPGRRLSHLARRRITFSSANLQAGGPSLVGTRARQILVDAKKIDLLSRRKSPRKTPKKTPSKSPKLKTRTPSSSAKKKLALRFRKLTGEIEKSAISSGKGAAMQKALFLSPDKATRSEMSTKRALFPSPNRDSNSSLFGSSGSHEKPQLRRALFASPLKGAKSPFKHALKFGFEKKRKRSCDSDDGPLSKFPRSFSTDVRPSTSNVPKAVVRCHSEMNISLNRTQTNGNELSEGHKKKLLWAVNGALQSQNITNSHPQWKIFASVLIRVTRRFYNSQMATCGLVGAKSDVGTTERMQRIARYHVISVIKGKSVDEIVNEHLKSRARAQRPQGYIPPEDFSEPRLQVPSTVKEHILQDRVNTIESWEKNRQEQASKPAIIENKIARIRKVINFGDDR